MATITALVAVGYALLATQSCATAAKKPTASSIVWQCKTDLAKRLKLPVTEIKFIEQKATTWPNAALGLPQIGKVYAQALTPGSRVTLEARNSRYLYTASAKAFRYGGPTAVWSYSWLYSKSVPNEANLNYDLYQCSFLGTNSVRIASGVSDYFPQSKGMVIIKRRTSRSGHDLLYVKADGSAKATMLYSAFDLGEAAFNDTQDQWAGFVRPNLGTTWNVVVAPTSRKNAKAQALSLPDGIRPGRIAWSGEDVAIMVKKGEQTLAFMTSPKAANPGWKPIGIRDFPGLPDYVLNKSESLEIDQLQENGRPVVEVARVWFTGDRNVKARIDGFTMRGSDLLGPYAVVWGEKGSEPAACAANIATGEVVPCASGIGGEIKPFAYPPHSSPIALGNPK